MSQVIYTMDCNANITAQDAVYPTYKKVDCNFHINANDDNFYGRLIDCTVVITHLLATACRSLDQGIRLVVTIDGVDVSDALIQGFNIQHDKNKISTFAINLGETVYSPRTNVHIDLDKKIVITAYINGNEKKLFTGLLDEPSAENTPKFGVTISGRDYGKLLLDKKMTLISVQDVALSTKRNDVIKYIAEQVGIISFDIPAMDPVTIDNSFQHQSLWDMIQKEAMIELYWVRFSEDNVMQLKLDEIKSDVSLYPTPDWSYNEDKFIRLDYKKTRIGINKIAILGATAKSRIPTIEDVETQLSFRKSWSAGTAPEDIAPWSPGEVKTQGVFTITTKFIGSAGSAWDQYFGFSTYISWSGVDFEFIDLHNGFVGDNVFTITPIQGRPDGRIAVIWGVNREIVGGETAQRGAILINIRGKRRVTTYETRYDQISAYVIDPNSIAKYGERDGGSIEYPFLETMEQCSAVGRKIIRNNHKLGVGSFEIPFNPLIETGQTITLSDRKIGLTERYLAERVGHNGVFDAEGKIKVRTVVTGIHYA